MILGISDRACAHIYKTDNINVCAYLYSVVLQNLRRKEELHNYHNHEILIFLKF